MFGDIFPKKVEKNKEYEYSYEEYDDMHSDYELQKVNDSLNEQISEVQNSYSALNPEMLHVKEENERLFNMNERLKSEVDQKQREIDQTTNKMMDYQVLITNLKKALEHAKAEGQEVQLKQLLVEEDEKRRIEMEERTRLEFVIEELKNEKKDVENKLEKRIHHLQGELEKNSTENHIDKEEIANVLLEAKGISNRMIEQAEKKARQIVNQANSEAHTKVFEAENELNELGKVAHTLYVSVKELKDESSIVFEELVNQLSWFNKDDREHGKNGSSL